LKNNIYKNNSHTLEPVKQNVKLRILKIAEESLQRLHQIWEMSESMH